MDSNLPPDSNPTPNPATAPPPYTQPPPIITPSVASRPTRKGGAWKISAVILLLLLAVSLAFNFRHAMSSVIAGKIKASHPYGPRLEEVTIKDNNAAEKIAVVPIEGVISGSAEEGGFSMVTIVKEQLKLAKEDREVKAVVLKVDSPGGEVMASDEIAKAITEFQDHSGKPVIVSMGSLGASGGYYVSAPCEWIVANDLTITGSIGVIMHGLNYRGLMDKLGLRPEVFKSGKYKDMMSGTKSPEEITPEEKQMMQKLIDETFDRFKSVVADGRQAAYQNNKQQGKKLSRDWEDYADGRILSGKEAYRLGFVDELGDLEMAVERAKKLGHVKKDADLVEYQPVFDISNLFHLLGKSDAKAIKIDLGVEIPKLRPGCLYFLAPNYLR